MDNPVLKALDAALDPSSKERYGRTGQVIFKLPEVMVIRDELETATEIKNILCLYMTHAGKRLADDNHMHTRDVRLFHVVIEKNFLDRLRGEKFTAVFGLEHIKDACIMHTISAMVRHD